MFNNADSHPPLLDINSGGWGSRPVICIFNKHSGDGDVDGGPQVKLPGNQTLSQRFACTESAGKCSLRQSLWGRDVWAERRRTVASVIPGGSGPVTALQRCWHWNKRRGLFPLTPNKQSVYTDSHREGGGNAGQGWVGARKLRGDRQTLTSNSCQHIAHPGVRWGHIASASRWTVVRSDAFTSKLHSLRGDMWSCSYLFWPMSKEAAYSR